MATVGGTSMWLCLVGFPHTFDVMVLLNKTHEEKKMQTTLSEHIISILFIDIYEHWEHVMHNVRHSRVGSRCRLSNCRSALSRHLWCRIVVRFALSIDSSRINDDCHNFFLCAFRRRQSYPLLPPFVRRWPLIGAHYLLLLCIYIYEPYYQYMNINVSFHPNFFPSPLLFSHSHSLPAYFSRYSPFHVQRRRDNPLRRP